MKTRRTRNRFSKYDSPDVLREKILARTARPSHWLSVGERNLHLIELEMLEMLMKLEA